MTRDATVPPANAPPPPGAPPPSRRMPSAWWLMVWASAFVACAVRLPADGASDETGIPCQAAMECPQPEDPCLLAYCMEQQCVHVPSPEGQLPEEAQEPGDCQQRYCDGNGQLVVYPAAHDLPKDDDNPCTEELCEGTSPKHRPTKAGVPCGEDGICNGAGKCGVCLPDAKRCEGHAVRSCEADGQWSKPSPCGTAAPVCSQSRCVALAEVALGRTHGCARFENGSVRCWGDGAQGRLGEGGLDAAHAPAWGSGFQGTVIGTRHGCAMDAAGAVWCWGAGDFGQLGNGTYASSAGPTQAGSIHAVALAVGESHSCALEPSGAVQCWGRNDRGQLGSGRAPAESFAGAPSPSASGPPRPTPQPIAGLEGVTALELPGTLTCVRSSAGQPRCWGNVSFPLPEASDDPTEMERLEKGSQSSPTPVAGLPPARQLVAGRHFTCALTRDGAVYCWGEGSQGQLGDGSKANRFEPVPVAGLSGVRQLAAGAAFACALVDDGAVRCWGANDRGQLGTGRRGAAARPSPIAGLANVTTLLTGEHFACAVQQEGPLVCWGAGRRGQLGNGTTVDAPRPLPVTW